MHWVNGSDKIVSICLSSKAFWGKYSGDSLKALETKVGIPCFWIIIILVLILAWLLPAAYIYFSLKNTSSVLFLTCRLRLPEKKKISHTFITPFVPLHLFDTCTPVPFCAGGILMTIQLYNLSILCNPVLISWQKACKVWVGHKLPFLSVGPNPASDYVFVHPMIHDMGCFGSSEIFPPKL